MKNSAILDSGTTIHIFNQLTRFLNFRTALEGDFIYAGSSKVPIQGYGDVDLQVDYPGKRKIVRLYDVAFCDQFACNIVSFRRLRQRGYWWDNKLPNNCVRSSDDSLAFRLSEYHGQNVIEYIPYEMTRATFFVRRNKFNSWTERPASRVDAEMWHLRLGHPGPEALQHLVNCSTGVKIKGLRTIDCNACAQAKIHRTVHREPRTRSYEAGVRLAIDFHDFEKTESDGTQFVSVMLVTDRYSGFVWDFYLPNREARTIAIGLEWLLRILDRQYQIKPRVIECDNELSRSHELQTLLVVRQGIKLEPSAPDTQAQNGGAERMGRTMVEKSRALRASSKLPHFLWTEVVRTAVYLYNRTPKYMYDWKAPYERFFTFLAYRDGIVTKPRKPQQAHLKVYGCKAYAPTKDYLKGKNKKMRLSPRAWIGFLVGYSSTNIFRIWNPRTNKIVQLRDVMFDESSRFDGNIQTLKDDLLKVSSEELDLLLENVQITETDTVGRTTPRNFDEDEDLGSFEDAEVGEVTQESSTPEYDPNKASYETDHLELEAGRNMYLTPEDTPPPPVALLAATIRDATPEQNQEEQSSTRPGLYNAQGCKEQLRTRPGSYGVEETKSSVPHYTGTDSGNWRTVFNSGRLVSKVKLPSGELVSKARLVRNPKRVQNYPNDKTWSKGGGWSVMHRTMLPAPPKTHKDITGHPYEKEWREAEKLHLQSHRELRTWNIVQKDANSDQKQLLDCMWVYIYKFDKHGYLQKCKARLVVRGDQQDKFSTDTYASTLAARSFRTLIAIAARFDLELIQFDVVNAFVNADLPNKIYMRMPPGYRTAGMILQLQKALYGLRESPLLWQKHFTKKLHDFGFRTIPHEPCCMSKDGILLFFYVDDIVLAYDKKQQDQADNIIDFLHTSYNLTGGGDLQWFLGIEIVRDRDQKKIWLSQASYIDKIAGLVENQNPRAAKTPMGQKELLPYEGHASFKSINVYQKKIGSILFVAVSTRPDIAFAVSRLARFNSNPSQQHRTEADRVILYLVRTKNLGLQFGGADKFEVASDASFADNTMDRTSSQAYVMKLFGGTIGWRANKQDTVTTSTTEAELLALAQAAKESMFQSRLVRELGVKLNEAQITI